MKLYASSQSQKRLVVPLIVSLGRDPLDRGMPYFRELARAQNLCKSLSLGWSNRAWWGPRQIHSFNYMASNLALKGVFLAQQRDYLPLRRLKR